MHRNAIKRGSEFRVQSSAFRLPAPGKLKLEL
jgi:hypothetical protein